MWIKSSRSAVDACVEVRAGTRTVWLRDSQMPTAGRVLVVEHADFRQFLAGLTGRWR